jgi:hypothetical protein
LPAIRLLSLVVRMRRSFGCLLASASACALAAGCAAQVPSYNAYRRAPLGTASAMVSSLATARLAGQLALTGRNLGAFANDNVTDSRAVSAGRVDDLELRARPAARRI